MNITNDLIRITSNNSDIVTQIKTIKTFIENNLFTPLIIMALVNNILTISTIIFLFKSKRNWSKPAFTFYLFIEMADICALSPFIYSIFGMLTSTISCNDVYVPIVHQIGTRRNLLKDS